MKILITFCLLIQNSIFAQNYVTNYVTAAPNFREVNGQLYNVERSVLWQDLHFRPEYACSNGIVAMKLKPIYRFIGGNGSAGYGFMGYDIDHQIFIAHCPAMPQEIDTNCAAMKTGVASQCDSMLESWDVGLPHKVPIVTQSQ